MTVEETGRWRRLPLGQRISWLTYCGEYERLASPGPDARRSLDPRHRGTMAASGVAPGGRFRIRFRTPGANRILPPAWD